MSERRLDEVRRLFRKVERQSLRVVYGDDEGAQDYGIARLGGEILGCDEIGLWERSGLGSLILGLGWKIRGRGC